MCDHLTQFDKNLIIHIVKFQNRLATVIFTIVLHDIMSNYNTFKKKTNQCLYFFKW